MIALQKAATTLGSLIPRSLRVPISCCWPAPCSVRRCSSSDRRLELAAVTAETAEDITRVTNLLQEHALKSFRPTPWSSTGRRPPRRARPAEIARAPASSTCSCAASSPRPRHRCGLHRRRRRRGAATSRQLLAPASGTRSPTAVISWRPAAGGDRRRRAADRPPQRPPRSTSRAASRARPDIPRHRRRRRRRRVLGDRLAPGHRARRFGEPRPRGRVVLAACPRSCRRGRKARPLHEASMAKLRESDRALRVGLGDRRRDAPRWPSQARCASHSRGLCRRPAQHRRQWYWIVAAFGALAAAASAGSC